ncbi:MAG TPA: alpha/beta hydrolase [Vicinamibacterales bacterium]|jgi:pimeloyl-ACP methyl ester carboxylesterase
MPSTSVRVGNLDFHVVQEGSGEPVLFLHGFPDSSRLWRHQIPAFLKAGFQVVAPDLRGFGDSDKPSETDAYAMPALVGDVVGILDQLEISRAHVVGHDWGAGVAWVLAAMQPQRVNRLVVLSVGHPATFFKAGLSQREKSWYMLLFQFRFAEDLLTRDNWAFFRDLVRHHPECDRWIEDLSRPGALAAALNWYRANVVPENAVAERWVLPSVAAPTLGIWSSGDAYLTETQMLLSHQCVSSSWTYERIEGASHWMQLDQPERVNDLILRFLESS